jgi:hypothetical protein
MHVQNFRAAAERKILVNVIAPLHDAQASILGRNAMKLKNLGHAVLMTVAAAALVLGTAGSSEAKGKKAGPKAVSSPSCMFTPAAPVCGAKGKMKFTYRNACWAGNDGAIVKSHKACKPAKAMKHGKKSGKKAMKKPMKK